VSFFLSKDRKQSREAAIVRHNRWAGWDVGDKVACIWGAPRDVPVAGWRARLRNLLLERQLFLDTAHLTEEKFAAFHKALSRFRPKVVLAYARSAVLFARYLRDEGLQPYRPHSIVTSAEVLEASDRRLLEEVFGCPVFNRYGCREVSVVASECEEHRGLHTMAEGLYVEVVRSPGDGQLPPGEVGTILVTDLLNFAMPLIRYRIGDMGAWEEGPCPCGRGLPRLRNVQGRVTDFVVGTDGGLVSGVFLATYVIAQRPSLGQIQLLQEERGKVRYRLRPGHNFEPGADLEYLGLQVLEPGPTTVDLAAGPLRSVTGSLERLDLRFRGDCVHSLQIDGEGEVDVNLSPGCTAPLPGQDRAVSPRAHDTDDAARLKGAGGILLSEPGFRPGGGSTPCSR
jgi:phenylacetate-CoA ligase